MHMLLAGCAVYWDAPLWLLPVSCSRQVLLYRVFTFSGA